MNQVIRGMKVKCKSRDILGDCIGLHGLMKKKDIPAGCKNKVPRDELWIRSDHCENNVIKDRDIVLHEDVELLLMKEYGLTYAVAHNIATIAEERWEAYWRRF